MERFKALVKQWRMDGDECLVLAANEPHSSLAPLYICNAKAFYSNADFLERAILATENEAFMESICPGFRDLDDVVATDAAQAVKEQAA